MDARQIYERYTERIQSRLFGDFNVLVFESSDLPVLAKMEKAIDGEALAKQVIDAASSAPCLVVLKPVIFSHHPSYNIYEYSLKGRAYYR